MKRRILVLTLFLLSLLWADEKKTIGIGDLQSWFSSAGAEVELGRKGDLSDQQDGLRWPAQFTNQDNQAAKGLWIGTINFNDPVANKVFNHKVVHVGPRVFNEKSEVMPVEFNYYGKFPHPDVFVNGNQASNIYINDLIDNDKIDPTIIPDRLLKNVVHTSIGLTMTRKIYAYSQQNHSNYFIYEYEFENTGKIDLNGTEAPQTLEGVMIMLIQRYAPSREGGPYGKSWLPQQTSWGQSTLNEVVGTDPNAGDPFRANYAWLGKHSGASFDIIGGPYINGDGHLGAAQYVGNVVLHADTSPTDQTDDPNQPTTTYYMDSDGAITSNNDQYNASQMTAEYEAMTKGHAAVSHAQAIGDGYADNFGSTAGGYSQTQGFGPYTIAPGQKIRIVIAEAVSGLDRKSAFSIGDNWLNAPAPFTLPDGGSTNDADTYKNNWVFTGKDSLFQTFNRAIKTYNNNFEVPAAPNPPERFEVYGQGDRILLNWAKNAESDPLFAGYRVYRALAKPDTSYEMVWECGPGTANPAVVNTYSDKSADRGFDYFYYVTAYNDGSNNVEYPGTPLESSKFFTMTNFGAKLKRPPGTDIRQIRVVPNPYNVEAIKIQNNVGGIGARQLLLVNLPPKCEIKIYTERGDLIERIDHVSNSGDGYFYQTTISDQNLVSGLYIAYIKVTEDHRNPATGELYHHKGQTTYVKFIVIR